MGWIGVWNDEHQGHAVSAIAVASPTDDDTHEVVDRYLETTTGYCAARVHDTDLSTPGKTLLYQSAGDVAIGAGLTVWVSDWTDVRTYAFLGLWFANTGANALAQCNVWYSLSATGAAPYTGGQSNALALGAGGTIMTQAGILTNGIWQNTYTAEATFFYVRLAVVGGVGATTVRTSIVGMVRT